MNLISECGERGILYGEPQKSSPISENEKGKSMRALTLAVTLLAVAGCGDTGTNNEGDIEVETITDVPETVELGLGEVFTGQRLAFQLDSVEESLTYTENRLYDPAPEGEAFVIARYSVRNIIQEPIPLNSVPTVDLINAAGATLGADTNASIGASTAGFVEQINPGVTYRGVRVWRIAEGDFDPATWKIATAVDPVIEVSLQ